MLRIYSASIIVDEIAKEYDGRLRCGVPVDFLQEVAENAEIDNAEYRAVDFDFFEENVREAVEAAAENYYDFLKENYPEEIVG